MLVSHRYRFIFIKSAKTAGTSVESYFEEYCFPEGEWEESHYVNEYVNPASGIVGYRGLNRPSNTIFYNHMTARELRANLPAEVWQTYFKFTTVRHPFDRQISHFYHFELIRNKDFWASQAGDDIDKFRRWLRNTGGVSDRHLYTINDSLAVDYCIRFESLHDGVREVCNQLGICADQGKTLPKFKSEFRKGAPPIHMFYGQEEKELVSKSCAWELATFEYGWPAK